MNRGRAADSSFALQKPPLADLNANTLTSWNPLEPARDRQVADFDDRVDAAFAAWDLREEDDLAIIDSFLQASASEYAEGELLARSNATDHSIRRLLRDSRKFVGSAEDVTDRRGHEESGYSRSGESSSGELSYLLQNYPHILQNQRIADFLIDPFSGITPAVVLNSIRQRQHQGEERSSAGVSVDRSGIEPGYRMMAATAKHTRDKFDAGEEDIAAIAKQISDHAEAIYQTWKSRGLAPTEILNCHTPQNAVDSFGSALTAQSSAKTPVSELLAQAPDMDNNNLEKLVNSFVNEDKARIAAQRNKSPSKTIPSSIQFALQKFEKNNASPQKPTSPSSNPSFVQKSALKSSPVKPTTPTQNPPAYSPKPAIGVKPQIAPKNFNLIQSENVELETIEVTYPPDIVPQKPEAPKRPAGLSLQTPANLQTWPLKNKVVDHKVHKSGHQTNNDSPLKANYSKGSPKPDKYSTLPGSPKTSSSYMDEVAREEERLINALKTGVVLPEDRDSVPFVPKGRSIVKKEMSPVREVSASSVKPDLIPTERGNASKDERDGTANPNISLVDYAKTKYRDNLENPLTQQRLDANKQLDIDRKANLVDPALGLQVMETRSKFEGSEKPEKSDKEGPAVAPPGRWGAPRSTSLRRVGADQVPHPELTTQQKQHIRAQADKVAGSPVRPFLTRGSVAERVLIFEKCPSELMLDKRKSPAITSWRTGHDVMVKAQSYGLGRCSSAPPASPAAPAAARPARSSNAGLPLPGGRRAAVPRFHFPRGRPPAQAAIDQAVLKVQSAFNTFPNSQVPRDSFHHIVKACDCPLYWKAPLFLATQRNLHTPVDGHKFIDFWRQLITQCHDQASRFVYVLTRGTSDTLGPEELAPLVQDVVDTHPGLSFLKEATEFHSRYVHTVIARIFYCVNRSWSGRITIQELRRTDLLQVLQLLEEEEDINQVTAYFSYEHFYVIYCKFWELDRDHDLFIDKQDLARHNDHALSSRMIERVVSGCVTRGSRRTAQREGDDPRMSYTEFVWFLLAEEDKQHPTAIEYWFRCMDLDGDGYLSMYELEYFYEEQMHRMEAIGIETLPFQDCLCQMLDMVQPAVRDKISLSDLKRCKMTPIFFDTFFNLEKYLDHEQRDPFASQRDHDAEGRELSEWDRFAAEEYELLVAEEGGSDAQEQVSYDETDDDCLSPNLDEILSTEVIEEASIMSVGPPSRSGDKSPLFSPTKMDPDASSGYVNLNSLYRTSPHEKAILSKPSDPYFKNGYLDRQTQSPANHKSLSLHSMTKMSNDGNNSFLYSHLLSPQRKNSSESENGRNPSVYTNLSSEKSQGQAVDYGKHHTSLGDGALNRLSFTSGINKIPDSYEKTVSTKIPLKEISAMNKVGIFNKDSLKSPKKEKPALQNYRDEEDEDYARDSDECSI